jgi:hypothetical protein
MIRRAQSFRLSPEIREAIENAAKYEIPPAVREAAARAAKFEMSPATRDALAAALEDAAEQARRASEAWQQSFARVIAPTIEQWRLQLPKVQTWAADYGPVLAKVGQQIRDAWRAAMPPNWVDPFGRGGSGGHRPRSRYGLLFGVAPTAGMSAIDLYWLPLGAGGHSVRWHGRVFEWFAAAARTP